MQKHDIEAGIVIAYGIHSQLLFICRFSEAAELIESERLYIEANIKTKMLSSETCYAAYLVFGFAETYARLNSAVSIIRNFYDESGHD